VPPEEVTQEIKANIVPEAGFDFEPVYVRRLYVGSIFSRVLAHLVGRTDEGSRALTCTLRGALHVAETGAGLSVYQVETGVCADAYAAGQTHEYADADNMCDIRIEQNDSIVSLKNEAGIWGSDIVLSVGSLHFEVVQYGVKFKNRLLGLNAVYHYLGIR